MLDRQSHYQTLRSPLSPLSDKQIDMSREGTQNISHASLFQSDVTKSNGIDFADFSIGPPSYDQAQAMDPIDHEEGCGRAEETMYLFARGWASGMQREAGMFQDHHAKRVTSVIASRPTAH